MINFVVGFVLGFIVATTGFAGVATMLDNGLNTVKNVSVTVDKK